MRDRPVLAMFVQPSQDTRYQPFSFGYVSASELRAAQRRQKEEARRRLEENTNRAWRGKR